MAINKRILYVNGTSTGASLSTLLNSAAEKTILKQWCTAKGITGIKWYAAGQSSANMALLRALISDMRANTPVQNHQDVLSGQVWNFTPPPVGPPPGTPVNSINSMGNQLNNIPYGPANIEQSDLAAANETQRFFNTLQGVVNGSGADVERESYNYPSAAYATNALRTQDYNNQWKPICIHNAWGLQYSPLGNDFSRKDGASTVYLGWFAPATCDYPQTIASTLTRLDCHAYVVNPNTAFPYNRSRIEMVATAWAAYRLNPQALVGLYPTGIPQNVIWENINTQFPILPIFSLEAAFMGPFCSASGSNKTFDECFNMYLTGNYAGGATTAGAACFKNWQSGAAPYNAPVFPDRNAIKEPDGYVLFEYPLAFAARPSLVNP